MRTTLTIEPDVAQQIRRVMAEKKVPLKQVVNEALRAGLAQTARKEKSAPFTVEPHSFGLKPGIDRDKLNQLADELDGKEFLRKYQR